MALPVSSQIMLYMSAQNELASRATQNVGEIRQCVTLDYLCTYILLDTFEQQSAVTLRYSLPPAVDKTKFDDLREEFHDKDVTDPVIFNRHVREAHRHFSDFSQAELRQKILVIWGHGNGLVMLDEEKKKSLKASQARVVDFAHVLTKRAKSESQIAFDIVAFDSCYMAMIETMYELREATKYVLCSSTVVDTAGFPYEPIFNALKQDGRNWDPGSAAKQIAAIYDARYLKKYPDGSRFLFVCSMDKIAEAMKALNQLGELMKSLIKTDAEDDPVRTAVSEALVGAGANGAYTYSLRFLKMLEFTLDGRIDEASFTKLQQQIAQLRDAIKAAFSGNMGDTSSKPVSPNFWAPITPGMFSTMQGKYTELEASGGGNAGWISFWQKHHRQKPGSGNVPKNYASDVAIGLPTAD